MAAAFNHDVFDAARFQQREELFEINAVNTGKYDFFPLRADLINHRVITRLFSRHNNRVLRRA